VTNVFLGSRFAESDGSIQIPGGGFECSPEDRVWLNEFSTVASWFTLDATNSFLFVIESISTPYNFRAIQLAHGPWDMDSLLEEIKGKLNGPGKDELMGTYTVTRVVAGYSTASSGAMQRCIKIENSDGTFFLCPAKP
jgi:hypothetical protein